MMRCVRWALGLGALAMSGCGGTAEIKPQPQEVGRPTQVDTSTMPTGTPVAQQPKNPAPAPALGGPPIVDAGDRQLIETDDLALTVPANWTRVADPKTVVTLLAPIPAPGDTFRDNIRVKKYAIKGTDNLDQILASQLKNVEAKFTLVGSGVLGAGASRSAWLAIKEKQPAAGQPSLTMIDYLIVHRRQLFVLHSMCETRKLDERRPTFDAIARSVSFFGKI